MLLSMNWIGDFVDLSGLDKEALIRRFTLSTAEVEDIIVKGADIHGVIVAEIASIENHPNSKKLHLLKINNGRELVDCVCGAPNVRVGMRVAFATEGGEVCGNPIRCATVAGYESHGMCCSEAELGLSADNSGLWEIIDDIPLGTDIKSVYGIDDIIFEVDNKSLTNRPDLWGHYGIAREFATLTGRPLKAVPAVNLEDYKDLPAVAVDVREKELCLRYTALKVENIVKHVSPVNMRIRLFYCGSRAINLLADLTNYVMMELGQPMHAFDLRRVDKIEVQKYDKPFTFKTLDDNERQIDENMLMICSGEQPVAVAGVMGGLNSEIEDDTNSLLLESATFDGVSIRKTSARLGLRTDASIRYEKFLDPELAPLATARFVQLLMEIDSGVRVISSFTDAYCRRYDTITIRMDRRYIDRYTGIQISDENVVTTLTALGFGVKQEGDSFAVTVPSWRATKDVTIKADLIEEITRIYGYDNFEISTTLSPLKPLRKETDKSCEDKMKDLLVHKYILHEVHSYIWCDAQKYAELGMALPENVKVINAQTPDHAVLRRSMIPTLMSFVKENKSYSDSYGLYEIGHTVNGLKAKGECDERKKLGVVLYDKNASEETLYLKARDIVLTLFRDIKHVTPKFVTVNAATECWQHPVNTASVVVGGKTVGVIGVPHPVVKDNLDKKGVSAFLELDVAEFAAVAGQAIAYVEPSKQPGIDIDLTLVCDLTRLAFDTVSDKIREVGGEALTALKIADIYESEDTQSITLRLTFTAYDRTLTKAELQPVTDRIVAELIPLGMTLKQ